jgi:hypothetical protein
MLRSARVRVQVCWFLLAGGAAAFGCGGSEEQSGDPSGSEGGATTGGSGNAGGGAAGSGASGAGGADTGVGGSAGSPFQSGGADSSGGSGIGGNGGATGGSGGQGGTGGAVGGTAGQGGTGGASGGSGGQGGSGGASGGSGGAMGGSAGQGGTGGGSGGTAGQGGTGGGCFSNGEEDPACVELGYPPYSYFCPVGVDGPPSADCVLYNPIDSGDYYCCPAGSGGAGGSGGTVVLDPPGPGIACGEATCDEDSELCCGDGSSLSCDTPSCQALVRLGCDDSVDCPGMRCCFGELLVNARIGTGCTSECDSLLPIQVCKEAGDCENGDSCHAFVCGGFDTGNVTLGLCTATAPEFCE